MKHDSRIVRGKKTCIIKKGSYYHWVMSCRQGTGDRKGESEERRQRSEGLYISKF